MQNKIKKMVLLQKKLNDETNSPSWVYGITKHGNKVNWLRCIHMEGAELIDSFPWKHWKDLNADADIENAKVELTDIYHFLLSYGIHSIFVSNLFRIESSLMKEATEKVNTEFGPENKFNPEKYDQLLKSNKFYNLIQRLNDETIEINSDLYNDFFKSIEDEIVSKVMKAYNSFTNSACSLINKIEKLNLSALSGSLFEEEKLRASSAATKVNYFETILDKFYDILRNELPFNLSSYYFGKNVLNQFRQDNGYKEKTYIKVWDGEEDNIVMIKFINSVEDAQYKEIYNYLDKIYKNIKEK